jgi:M6 family metalloprotease-like protein
MQIKSFHRAGVLRPYLARGTAAIALALLVLASACERSTSRPGDPGDGGLTAAGNESIEGTFHVKWGDPPVGPPVMKFSVTESSGRTLEVLVDEGLLQASGGMLRLNGKRVLVTGPIVSYGMMQALTLTEVGGLQPSDAETQAVLGSQPHVSILCRFSDNATTPVTVAYVQGLTGITQPGLDHYWREISGNLVNLNGSLVVGWFVLPHPRSHYIQGSANLEALSEDCATAADAAVHFPSFVGVNFFFNANLDCCAWGGSTTLNRDGVNRSYRAAWMPPWGYQNQSVLAHEMGHGFGLPHSSGPYSQTYDSEWDVMSGGDGPVSPPYGTIGTSTISYHLHHLLGWITAARAFTAPTGTSTVVIERSDQPPPTGLLMAIVPIPGTTDEMYTVEARRFVGYDAGVPAEAIVIHHVDRNRSNGRPANVVDGDNDGDANDAGAQWLPGETFSNPAKGISITVGAASGTGWQVTINLGSSGGGAPGVPTLISATPTSSTSINLLWQEGPGDPETSFEVFRKTGKSFTRISITAGNATTFQDTSLSPGVLYTYYVRACNAIGCSANSAQMSATTPTGTAGPAAPSNLTAAPGTAGSIDLDWNDNSANETEFRIQRRTVKTAFAQVATVGPNATSHTNGGLLTGRSYIYRVQACNAVGCSVFSNEATAVAP